MRSRGSSQDSCSQETLKTNNKLIIIIKNPFNETKHVHGEFSLLKKEEKPQWNQSGWFCVDGAVGWFVFGALSRISCPGSSCSNPTEVFILTRL